MYAKARIPAVFLAGFCRMLHLAHSPQYIHLLQCITQFIHKIDWCWWRFCTILRAEPSHHIEVPQGEHRSIGVLEQWSCRCAMQSAGVRKQYLIFSSTACSKRYMHPVHEYAMRYAIGSSTAYCMRMQCATYSATTQTCSIYAMHSFSSIQCHASATMQSPGEYSMYSSDSRSTSHIYLHYIIS
jgi:hypothetical protein